MKRYIKSAVVNVSEMSWQEKGDFARDPEASPNILRQIFSSCDASETALLSYLATNPSTPVDVLSAMADMNDQELHKDLLYNENLPKEILDRLASEDNYTIQYGIAQHHNTSAKTLRRLVSHNNRYDILSQVVTNPNVTLSIALAALKKSPDVRVADRYNTPVEVLEKLAEDDEWLVAQEAKNTLAMLSRWSRSSQQ